MLARAHRVAFAELVGPIPAGRECDHLCRVPGCVNPAHIELVTHRANMLRSEGFPPAMLTRTHCPSGHPYDEQNTGSRKGLGWRRCKECDRRSKNKYAAKKAEEKRRKRLDS